MRTPVCILQVEDIEEDVVLMEYAFAEAALPAILRSVSDGQMAIDYLSGAEEYSDRKRYPLPHIVLLDLKLPGVSGWDVLSWIRNEPDHRSLPVFMLTSSGQAFDVEEAYARGANAFLTKPSGIIELIEMLRALGSFWLRFAQLPHAVIPAART